MLHQIGVGALGPVFRTYEPERDRLVAVKAFRLDITPEQAHALADELSRAAEAGLFHPSIVEPIAAGVQGTLAYGAEEYVAAESLDVAMRHYAPAPITTVLPFITQLAGAIDFARAAGVGHGALHPRDIFVTPEEARATGFGVVEALERVGLRAPVRRPYTAPERIAGTSWTTTADVFSLAAITYELLTARRPSGLGSEIGALSVGTPSAWMDALQMVLARAMDPDPSKRYPTALAFASALEGAARGVPAAAQPAVPPAAAGPSAADTAATVVSARAMPADAVKRAPEQAVSKEPHKVVEEPEDDIAAERFDDEADHELRLSEREDVFRRDPSEPLDDDIAAEAEADRFIDDDLPLDRTAVTPAAAARSESFRPADRPRDADADRSETMVAAHAPSSPSRPRDTGDDETIRRPRVAVTSDHRPIPFGTAAAAEPDTSRRSPVAAALLIVAGIAVGLLGGYAYWGRDGGGSADSSPTAATSGSAAGTSTPATGREFSEQAVTPPAPSTTGRAAGGSVGRPEAAAPGGDRPARPAESAATAPSNSPRAATAGTLVVRSTPTGAGVTLNGRWRGRTPLTLDALPFRRYDVRVVQPGYATATEAVVLSADQPARSLTLQLKPAAAAAAPRRETPAAGVRPAPAPDEEPSAGTVYTGSIYVDSRPRGARVTIDGKEVGVTPLRVGEVRIGSHVVRLELPDHRIWSTTTRVTAGQEQRVTGSLERIQ